MVPLRLHLHYPPHYGYRITTTPRHHCTSTTLRTGWPVPTFVSTTARSATPRLTPHERSTHAPTHTHDLRGDGFSPTGLFYTFSPLPLHTATVVRHTHRPSPGCTLYTYAADARCVHTIFAHATFLQLFPSPAPATSTTSLGSVPTTRYLPYLVGGWRLTYILLIGQLLVVGGCIATPTTPPHPGDTPFGPHTHYRRHSTTSAGRQTFTRFSATTHHPFCVSYLRPPPAVLHTVPVYTHHGCSSSTTWAGRPHRTTVLHHPAAPARAARTRLSTRVCLILHRNTKPCTGYRTGLFHTPTLHTTAPPHTHLPAYLHLRTFLCTALPCLSPLGTRTVCAAPHGSRFHLAHCWLPRWFTSHTTLRFLPHLPHHPACRDVTTTRTTFYLSLFHPPATLPFPHTTHFTWTTSLHSTTLPARTHAHTTTAGGFDYTCHTFLLHSGLRHRHTTCYTPFSSCNDLCAFSGFATRTTPATAAAALPAPLSRCLPQHRTARTALHYYAHLPRFPSHLVHSCLSHSCHPPSAACHCHCLSPSHRAVPLGLFGPAVCAPFYHTHHYLGGDSLDTVHVVTHTQPIPT